MSQENSPESTGKSPEYRKAPAELSTPRTLVLVPDLELPQDLGGEAAGMSSAPRDSRHRVRRAAGEWAVSIAQLEHAETIDRDRLESKANRIKAQPGVSTGFALQTCIFYCQSANSESAE